MINLERSRVSIQRRIGLVNLALGLDQDRPLLFINARGRTLAEIYEAARQDVVEHKVGLVVLDSLSRAGFGKLTEDAPANAAMDMLNRLCDTWLALGHTPRTTDEHVYGNTMFDAAMDVGIQMLGERKDDGTLGIGLQVRKANDIPHTPLQVWALEFDQWGLVNVREGKRREFTEIEAGRRMSMKEQIREYLFKVGDATATHVADVLGFDRSRVSMMFNRDPAFVQTRRDGTGAYYAVKAEER